MIESIKLGYQLVDTIHYELEATNGNFLDHLVTSKTGAIRTPDPVKGIEVDGNWTIITTPNELNNIFTQMEEDGCPQLESTTMRILSYFSELLIQFAYEYEAIEMGTLRIEFSIENPSVLVIELPTSTEVLQTEDFSDFVTENFL